MTKIITVYDPKPVPSTQFDWSAETDEYELGDPVGYGSTEAEAIEDLKTKYREFRNEDLDSLQREEARQLLAAWNLVVAAFKEEGGLRRATPEEEAAFLILERHGFKFPYRVAEGE